MEKRENCLLGYDDDGSAGLLLILIVIAIIITIVVLIASILVIIGACIGGFFSIRNYVLSFKENVIDSNRHPEQTVA